MQDEFFPLENVFNTQTVANAESALQTFLAVTDELLVRPISSCGCCLSSGGQLA